MENKGGSYPKLGRIFTIFMGRKDNIGKSEIMSLTDLPASTQYRATIGPSAKRHLNGVPGGPMVGLF